MRYSSFRFIVFVGLFISVSAARLDAQCSQSQWSFATAITETCGNVGIKTTTPLATLHVGPGADSPTLGTNNSIYATNNGPTFITARDSSAHAELSIGVASLGGLLGNAGLFGTRTPHDLYLQANGQNYVILKTGTGRFGIGTDNAQELLHLETFGTPGGSGLNMRLGSMANLGTTLGSRMTILGSNVHAAQSTDDMRIVATTTSNGASAMTINGNSGIVFHTISGATTAEAQFSSPRMTIAPSGLVTIGTDISNQTDLLVVNGGITAKGVIGSKWQDVAEWVAASGDVPPGTVVILNPEVSNAVIPSTNAYDTTVAGVISARPGIILGEGSASKAQVATTGRVKVRVDATKEAVHIGDLLVTSDKPGVAMKSIPMQINGRSFHQPGTVIGKALEPLSGTSGEILVLLSLQ